ncbi:nucleoside-diphosphate kinase [Candidatus Dojkabacteria bacterium]|jgi:nucleoside-diphosphate kinase|nr:nucleoside-diphosphate kinase [Candidatus Dojkabacteria bacterium]
MKIVETTLVIIKNKTIERGLVGEIIKKFEDVGLKIVAMRMEKPSKKIALEHYIENKGWNERVGKKAIAAFRTTSEAIKNLGTDNPKKVGKAIYDWSVDQLKGKEVIIMALRGVNAVNKVLAITGSSNPSEADLSTIRGQFSSDSFISSNLEKRALYNVVHRSGSAKEAKYELKVWFKGLK